MPLYDQMYARVNGQPLAENTTLSVGRESDDQEILTILQGFAGISPSPIMTRISGTEVVPISGIEFDVEKMYLERQEVSFAVQFGGSGKTLETKGYFVKALKLDAGVGKPVALDFEFVGQVAAFQ